MSTPNQRTALETLEEEYLLIRAKLLEVAASLARIQRGHGDTEDDHRLVEIANAITILQQGDPNLAEKLQLTFSLPYKNDWQSEFGLC